MNQNGVKTMQDLIDDAFTYLNAHKRHRALAVIKNNEKDYGLENFHKYKAFEFFDSLELTLRAIQKKERERTAQQSVTPTQTTQNTSK